MQPPRRRYNEIALKQDNSGYTALREGAAIVDRSAVAAIQLTGNDRRSYLQGLLTNDIVALVPGTGCYAAMLTAQGRMITDMRVLELGDAVLVEVPAAVAPAIREHLDRFVFAEDVQVADVTATRVTVGLYGPKALEILQRARTEGSAPSRTNDVSRVRIAGREALLVRSDAVGPGYDVIVDGGDAGAIGEALRSAGAGMAAAEDAEAVRIEHAYPLFGLDMDTETIPLEAGLEDRAISRSKGCYVGQEVIVRVQDRGQGRVAKRLVPLTFNASADVPAIGARISSGDREIGRVTSAAFSPSLGRPIALGYVHRDFAEAGTHLTVAGADAVVSRPLA
jgi:folate-binding protein YgfZ